MRTSFTPGDDRIADLKASCLIRNQRAYHFGGRHLTNAQFQISRPLPTHPLSANIRCARMTRLTPIRRLDWPHDEQAASPPPRRTNARHASIDAGTYAEMASAMIYRPGDAIAKYRRGRHALHGRPRERPMTRRTSADDTIDRTSAILPRLTLIRWALTSIRHYHAHRAPGRRR